MEVSISNYDGGVIYPGVENAIIKGEFCDHPAWDHYGIITHADGVFKEEVSVYGKVVDICEDSVLSKLIVKVNNKWGVD